MIFGKHSKALTNTKTELFYEIAESSARFIENNLKKKNIVRKEISAYGSVINSNDMLGQMKEAIRNGNGHIKKIEVLKPVNNHSFPDQTHSFEISFQGMEKGSAPSHVEMANDHIRLIGITKEVKDIFADVEKMSIGVRQKAIEFTLAWLGHKGVLKLPKSSYAAEYSIVEGIKITDGKNIYLVNGAIESHINGSHATDIYVFDPERYSLDTKSLTN